MYLNVKKALKESGELMVNVSGGQTFELHLHNTKFDDGREIIELNAGAETYWINGNQVVYMWVHRVKA